jgi:hypothetical protein
VIDADGVLMRILAARAIDDSLRIEDGDVAEGALRDVVALDLAKAPRGQ